jgi:hypothetical protein
MMLMPPTKATPVDHRELAVQAAQAVAAQRQGPPRR